MIFYFKKGEIQNSKKNRLSKSGCHGNVKLNRRELAALDKF